MSNNNIERRHERVKKTNKISAWVAIGAVVLIILLFIWLTMADLWGDTDVAAFAVPGLFI